ncbi:MAG: 16S rRNA (guanine(527)-N(7))-methyltransferase RsmG [Treponema sp.]|nr:16S rRNA (guanine(527)-N(7))-methyltransferase RsmG [Treponema sp.]
MADDLLLTGLQCLRESDASIDALLRGRVDIAAAQMGKYIEEIELFNPAYKLVGAQNRRELVIRHILDSLSPLGALARLLEPRKRNARIADVGSGAGLPGIPLAIALPDCSFTLIERMGRRAGFLRNTQAVLALPNVTIEEKELEQAGGACFDLVVFRAFKPLEPALLKSLFALLAPDGVLAAYKGRASAIADEIRRLNAVCELIPIQTPFLDEERHLLLIQPVSRLPE